MKVIVCPTCSTQYQVNQTKLTDADTLRCKKCETVISLQQKNDMFSSIAGGLQNTTFLNENSLPQYITREKQPLSQDMSSHVETSIESSTADHDLEYTTNIRDSLDSHKGIETIFKKEGKLIEVRGNKPLLLNTSEYVWLVNAGTIDIFSVRIEHGEAVGARNHLLRLETGQIAFGFDAEKYGKEKALLAVGTLGSSLLELDVARLQRLSKTSPESSEAISRLIDEWIAAFSLSVKRWMTPKNCINLDLTGKIQLQAQTNYKPQEGIRWVKHITGASTFMGRTEFPEIGENGYFPVYAKVWLQTRDNTQLRYGETAGIIRENGFWKALEHFFLFLLDCIIIHETQKITAEKERLQRKAEDESVSLQNAFLNLVSVVKTEKAIHEVTGDPLLSACRAIGKELNITFTPHPDAKKGRTSLDDIVRASRVRKRQVVLKDKWWHQDNGPLLAFKEDDKTPVALLPVSPKKYVVFDPMQETRTIVTEEIAASLNGLAYTFYTPFPDTAIALLDVLKLGFRGTRKDIVTVVIMGILGALLGMVMPIATGVIFSTVIPGAAAGQLLQIGIILVVCAIATGVFGVTKGIAMLRIEGKADLSLQAAIMDRLLLLPTTFFKKYTAGDLASRTLGINAIRQILAGVTVRSVLSGIFSLFYAILLIYYDWYLALFALGVSLLTIIVTFILGYMYVRYERPINEFEGKISGIILQLILGISKLRITGTEDRAFAVWTQKFSVKRKLAFKSRQVQNVLATFNAMIPVFASMIIFYVVMSRILNPEKGGLLIGNFLAFLSAYTILQVTLADMSTSLVESLRVIPFYDRLQPILSTLPEVDMSKTYPGEITGDIEISHVNFRYRPDGPLILKDASMHIKSGEFVAIVGGSGSGKSTLMRLLLGFETLDSGAIYYDGQDLSKVDVLEIRRQIGVVLQTSQIMMGSIYENIVGAGSATLTIDDAWEAARMAGCYDDIKAMPMGMHTYLPPGGGSLSGGQRQRVLIARAIVKKPRVLFFDEATSALDNKTQAIVSESIEKLQSTRIVIAHRLSTIMNADRIYVMDRGRIVQCGAYDELMNQEGLFAELAKRQIA